MRNNSQKKKRVKGNHKIEEGGKQELVKEYIKKKLYGTFQMDED